MTHKHNVINGYNVLIDRPKPKSLNRVGTQTFLFLISMGFLQLIPADKLAALYDTSSRQLRLFAKGNAQQFTSGISFYRDPQFVGGLKFDLQGWVGPLGTGQEPYTKTQNFSIQLPSPVINSKSVIIADANHPEGVQVEIHYTGLGTTAADLNGAGEFWAIPAAEVAPTQLPGQETIRALFKEPFSIKQSAGVSKQGGSVDIKFDPAFLELTDAGIQGGDIAWTFNSLQMGNTQVIVTIFGGIAKFVMQRVYDVTIFVLADAKPATDTLILNFLGRVNIAMRLIREQYPDAQLYEVQATGKRPSTNPNDISQLKVVCRAGKGTAIISSTGWGEFGPVSYVDQPWLEDVVINWPVSMDLSEADSLLKQAGFTGSYGNVTLRHPLYPGVDEPYYIFGMTSGQYVFVGVNDKKVTVNRAGQPTVVDQQQATA
ncbi:hypothetical protein ACFSUS_21250 [Spirosoma soli]|uniref:Uncharacterized protein n=1 Tax=Spirosoma soli TaxID=1770529 RepID=A0ABW5M857_9BACT